MNDNHNPAFQEWVVDYFNCCSKTIGRKPEMFYCSSSQSSTDIIEKWLIQHQYYDTIPTQMIYTQTQKD